MIIPSLSSILSLFCLVDFLVNNPLKGPISISLKYIRRNSNGPLKVSSYSTVVYMCQSVTPEEGQLAAIGSISFCEGTFEFSACNA